MAKRATKRMPGSVAQAQAPAAVANRRARLEDCRERLQSIELLLGSSPRDTLALSRALLDDVVGLLAAIHLPEVARATADYETVMRELRDPGTRAHLAAARRWLEESEASGIVSGEGIVALRQVVADLVRPASRGDVTGLAAFQRAFGRITWLHAGIAAAVVVTIVIVALLMSAGRERGAAAFEARMSEGNAKLAAGDHAGAVQRFQDAVAAMPDKDATADAWNNMGWSLLQLGRHDEAIAAFRKALLLRPVFQLARNNLDEAQRKLDLKKSENEQQRAPAGK